jgi:YVTN family beta-propeller protein
LKVKVCKLLAFIFIIIFALSAANAVHAVGVITSPISVGNEPEGLAYDPAKGEIFVANGFSSSVSVISDSNNSVVATINLATSPGPIVYDSGKGEIFVGGGANSNLVSVISDSNDSVVSEVTVGSPSGLTYDSAKGEMFISDWSAGTVSVISDSSILPPLSTPTSSPSPTPIESPPPNSSQTEVATTITALTVEPNPDVLNQTVSIGNFTISNGNGSGWSTLTISALIQLSPPSSTDVFRDLTLNVLEPDGGTEMSGPYTSSSDGSVSFTWSGVLEVGNVTLTLSFHGELFDNNSVYYQPSSSSIIVSVQAPATPTPTSASTPALTSSATTVPATTDKGSIVDLAISGNITSSQMSNVTIATNQSAASTTVSFTVTGERGTTGFSNITIPISVVAYGTPTIYIDGQPAQSQGYTQDANNYYVWYTTSFSTHQISIVFTTASSNPSASPNQTWPSLVQSVMFGVASAIAIAIIAAFALECKKSIRTTFDFKQKTKKMRKL